MMTKQATPHIHLPGPGDDLHFFHANGFPAGVYHGILSKLSAHFNVYAMQCRATWPDIGRPSHKNWQVYADDLIEFIEQHCQHPIVAVGHSLGASSTVLAAIKRPDLFKAVILIEPAMVDWPMRLLMKFTPMHIMKRNKLISGTLNKTERWQKKDDYLSYIKRFKGFNKFSEQTFLEFEKHAIEESPQGDYRLTFNNLWEAHNYTQAPFLLKHLNKLTTLGIPTVAIAGKSNLFFGNKLWQKWKTSQPKAVFLQDEKYGHLMPLEGPNHTFDLIMQGLKKLNVPSTQ
jgi:pimeloyl-ACP methyl ester carboxylesterase